MNATAAELARAMRRIRDTYGMSVAMWRGMSESARRTWLAPA
jgi:hypothetical protein